MSVWQFEFQNIKQFQKMPQSWDSNFLDFYQDFRQGGLVIAELSTLYFIGSLEHLATIILLELRSESICFASQGCTTNWFIYRWNLKYFPSPFLVHMACECPLRVWLTQFSKKRKKNSDGKKLWLFFQSAMGCEPTTSKSRKFWSKEP